MGERPEKPIYIILGNNNVAIGRGKIADKSKEGVKSFEFQYSGIMSKKVPLYNIPSTKVEIGRKYVKNGKLTNTEVFIFWFDIFNGETTSILDGNMIHLLQKQVEMMMSWQHAMESQVADLKRLVNDNANRDKMLQAVKKMADKVRDIQPHQQSPFGMMGGYGRSYGGYTGSTSGGTDE